MKVKQTVFSEKGLKKWDWRSMLKIEINGKKEFWFLDGEPEDANCNRDFNDVYKIVKAMKRAYEAGVAGENFEIEKVEVNDLD